MKRTFKDNNGREWIPVMNGYVFKRFSERTGITLEQLQGKRFRLHDIMALLWSCCERQAASERISEEQFFSALDGNEITEAGGLCAELLIGMFPTTDDVPEVEGEGGSPAPLGPGGSMTG